MVAARENLARSIQKLVCRSEIYPYLTGQQERGARKEFVYFNEDGDVVAVRYENWKLVFEEQRAPGTMRIWAEHFTKLRVPKVFDRRIPMSARILRRTPTTTSSCRTERLYSSRRKLSWPDF
jgi:hypothetical protein